MRARTLALCGAALLFAACSNDFEKQSQITRLRVLGVQAEPAELIYSPDGGFPATTLTALAVEPSDAAISSRFSLCLAQGVLPAPDIGCPGDAGIDLPPAGPLAARLDFADPAIQALALSFLAAADAGSGAPDGGPLDQFLQDGLPIVVGFELTAPPGGNPDGGPPPAPGFTVQRQLGLTSVTLRAQSQDKPLNHNPQLRGLSADGVELAADGSSTLRASTKVTLLPLPADGAKELASGTPEKLNFSFFATGGEIGSLRSADTTATGEPGLASIDYDTPTQAGPVRLWVVVRDGRGGVGWIERRVTIAQ